MATYIRYAVMLPGQSSLCARHTPRYFSERERKKAYAYAESIGSYVVDLFKEMDRH
jgi:hypothetical protein